MTPGLSAVSGRLQGFPHRGQRTLFSLHAAQPANSEQKINLNSDRELRDLLHRVSIHEFEEITPIVVFGSMESIGWEKKPRQACAAFVRRRISSLDQLEAQVSDGKQ